MDNLSYPVFIPSNPDGKDGFPEEAHTKLANSISVLIKNKEPLSRIIGLEGDWGSGKSNVIKMIENNLATSHATYVHDLWRFQDDSQRRTLLESLTNHLCNKQGNDKKPLLLKAKERLEKLKELFSKEKEITNKVVPVLSLAFVLGIVGIGFWQILGELGGPMTIDPNARLHPRLLIMPYILLGYLILSIKARRPLKLNEIRFYNLSNGNEKINETIYESEPSLYDFSKWIKELQSEFPKGKELLIVFDNMDRIPEDKVKQFWSLIHSFYSEEDFDKIWVIVPYSTKRIEKALNFSQEEAEHFIDKTFTIRYNVPAPIIKDWKDFFDKMFKKAFGSTEGIEKISVQNIFDRSTTQITPRKIINFINDIVRLKKLWKDEIPLKYLALYSMNKNIILNELPHSIISNTFLGNCATIFSNDKKAIEYISAITYNINHHSAYQIILKGSLQSRLRGEHKENIDDFAKHPYFMDILESAILEQGGDTIYFELIINDISEDLYNKIDSTKWNHIWKILEKNYLNRIQEKNDFNNCDQVFLLRLKENQKQSFLDDLIKKLDIPDEKFSGSKYYKAIKDIEDFCKKNNLGLEFKLTTMVKSTEIFLDYLNEAKEDYINYKISADNNILNNILIERFPDKLNEVQQIKFLKGDANYDLSRFTSSLSTEFNVELENKIDANNFKPIITLLKELIDERPIPLLLPLYKTGELIPSMASEPIELTNLFAMNFKHSINTHSGIPIIPFDINSEQFKEQFENCIEDYLTLGELIKISFKDDGAIFRNIAKNLILNKSKKHNIDLSEILPLISRFQEVLNISINESLEFFNVWNIEAKEIINSKSIKRIFPTPHTFDLIMDTKTELSEHIKSSMIEFIEEVQENSWKEYLKEDQSFEFEVVNILLKRGLQKIVPKNLLNAYFWVLEEISKGNFNVPSNYEKWDKFYEYSDLSKMSPTLKNVRDHFINTSPNEEQFKFFEFMLRTNSILNIKKECGDVTRKILTPLIDVESIRNNYILEYSQYYANIINKGGSDSYPFKERINTLMLLEPENTRLSEFASKLK